MTETLLLVGAGGNLGTAIARRFGREGWRVALVARRRERLEAQAAELRGQGVEAEFEAADVGDVAAVARLVEGVERRHGAPSAVIYNAAAVKQEYLLNVTPQAIVAGLMANAGGALAVAHAAVPGMLKRGGGSMIFTGGGLALAPRADFLPLSMGKSALHALVKALAADPALTSLHFAHVIIHRHITPSVGEELAEVYWALHNEPEGARRIDFEEQV